MAIHHLHWNPSVQGLSKRITYLEFLLLGSTLGFRICGKLLVKSIHFFNQLWEKYRIEETLFWVCFKTMERQWFFFFWIKFFQYRIYYGERDNASKIHDFRLRNFKVTYGCQLFWILQGLPHVWLYTLPQCSVSMK